MPRDQTTPLNMFRGNDEIDSSTQGYRLAGWFVICLTLCFILILGMFIGQVKVVRSQSSLSVLLTDPQRLAGGWDVLLMLIWFMVLSLPIAANIYSLVSTRKEMEITNIRASNVSKWIYGVSNLYRLRYVLVSTLGLIPILSIGMIYFLFVVDVHYTRQTVEIIIPLMIETIAFVVLTIGALMLVIIVDVLLISAIASSWNTWETLFLLLLLVVPISYIVYFGLFVLA